MINQNFELELLTDVPRPIKDDTLQVLKYVRGLESFIKICHTPISISLQGDWGTGKTTFLKTMENNFKNNFSVKTVYFNTWQYSQFNMSNGLFISLLSNIINQLVETDKSIEPETNIFFKKVIKILNNAKKISPLIIADAFLSKVADVKISDYKDELDYKEEKEQAREIYNLKNDFKELIQKVNESNIKKNNIEHSKVVVFIDDLDRLEPQRAVEMLEVLKLFMDVEGCIYILAIDYDVVVAGVRQKYGSNMTEEKCRAFFDKIIQLPFNMPVERYDVKPLIKNIIKSDLFGDYVDIVSDFIRDTLGSNPRALKRLITSFVLLTSMEISDKHRSDLQQSLLILTLTIQMCNLDAYRKLHKFKDKEELINYFNTISNTQQKKDDSSYDDPIEYNINNIMMKLHNTIQKITDKKSDDGNDNIIKQLLEELKLSSITSNSDKSNSKIIEDVFTTIIDEKEATFSTQIAAMLHIINELLKNESAERINDLVANKLSPKLLKFKNEKDNSYFRQSLETNIKCSDKKLYLGTSTNIKTKSSFLKNLVNSLGNKHKVSLKNGEEILFTS